MKLLRKATYAIVLAVMFSFTFQCSSSKAAATTTTQFEESATFKVKPVLFQEWYAGIKVGGTGINMFVPVANKSENIKIDSVFFRNLKGKLVQKKDKYVAILKSDSPYYSFTVAEKSKDYPFTLSDAECAISFVENGETKYLKITDVNEVSGTYYENGPPSINDKTALTVVASTDEDTEH